jgi:DNA-binding transcriptional LysR family regulator
VGDLVEHKDLEVVPFAEDRVVLFVNPEQAPAGAGPFDLDTVLAAGLIVREPGSATRATGERALRAAGAEPALAMELGSNEAVKHAVLAGLGVGMLSAHAVALEQAAGRLVVLDVPAFDGRRMLYSARHRAKPLSRAQEAFLTLAAEMLQPPDRVKDDEQDDRHG